MKKKLELRMSLIPDEIGKTVQNIRMEIDRDDLDLTPEQFSERILVPAWAAIRNAAKEQHASEN